MKNPMQDQSSQKMEPQDHDQHIPRPTWGWKAIYMFLIVLGIASGIIGLVYRRAKFWQKEEFRKFEVYMH